MMRVQGFARMTFFLLVIATGYYSEIARADISGLGDDGWHTWQVEAIENAPEMCCFSWRNGTASRKQCDLDNRHGGFNGTDGRSVDSAVQIYALMKNGDVTKVRALSPGCPVVSATEIADLGLIDADDSADWLKQFVAGSDVSSNAISAIAVHDGSTARNILTDAAKPGNELELREEAIFWMAQVRVAETADDIKRYLFDDDNADIREHAAFSYSQSTASDVAATLIQQGQTDDNADVRSQAWFWLAQTEAAESEAAIGDALLNDEDDDVREEAVFALSQLPEDRAVKALAAVLENRDLGIELREQALFWLAQTESDEAFEFIDRLLSDN